MAMTSQEIEDLIKKNLPGAQVTLTDLAGDGEHYAVHVIHPDFRGKPMVQQHKMVYEALEGNMGGILHALAVKTSLPPLDER
jgi:stress-induced morphogen